MLRNLVSGRLHNMLVPRARLSPVRIAEILSRVMKFVMGVWSRPFAWRVNRRRLPH